MAQVPSKSVKPSRRRRADLDPYGLRAGLRSADATIRLRALHRICPCGSGFRLYERFFDDVKRLQKDPDERVRQMALHVEQDAYEIEAIDARLETASDFGLRTGDADWTRRMRQRQATSTWEPSRRS